MYQGEHSITFTIDSETFNTWSDWSLIPVTRPHVGPPEQEIMYQNENQYEPLNLELPGQFGILKQRNASWQFAVYNDYTTYYWSDIYSMVLAALQGKIGTFVLEDAPNYFYRGRFRVSEWESGKSYSTITIEAECEPYKYSGERHTITQRGNQLSFISRTDQKTPCNLGIRIYGTTSSIYILGLQRQKFTGNEYPAPCKISNVSANHEYQILGENKELTEMDLSTGQRLYINSDNVSQLFAFPSVIRGNNSVLVTTSPTISSNDIEIVVSYLPRFL